MPISPSSRRAKLIRNATPDIREELFEMQNRICDLCGYPIQDLVVAALDHSTPVSFFARSDMPIEEAILQANDPKNLRCAHTSCNNTKKELTREDWFACGLNNRTKPQPLTDSQLREFQFRLGAGGRRAQALHPEVAAANGRAQGIKMTNNGDLARIRSLPQTIAAHHQRGRDARDSGQLASVCVMGGRAVKAMGLGIHAMNAEQRSEAGRKGGRIGGRIQGPKSVQDGTGIFGLTPEQKTDACHKGGLVQGPIQGHRNLESGQIQALGRKAAKSGQLAKRGHRGRHNRWHIKRGIFNPVCALCQAIAPLSQ